ncbi:MAG: glutamyl-tRNA reductase [Verrucomicrobiales bacterium]|nr:glutamyl-tRNA reductase [Verrucomicrobiales bacterium]MCP5528410.1 glutamyl-tRNA reductase [Verrucomicrobiales bacterium]
MAVVVVGVNHRTAPVAVRERLAFAESEIAPGLERLRREGVADEGAILSTCNRVELYVAGEGEGAGLAAAARQFLLASRSVAEVGPDDLYVFEEPESLVHLFRVASGLDSMVLGETEILGQLKKAYDLALRCGATGRSLNKAFQRAFNVAKQIRTETNIQRGTVSVSSVAVDLAGRIFDTLERSSVLVIGAGDTGEKAAKAMLSRGARGLRVTNRSPERAQKLAAELGGEAVPFETWPDELTRIDVVISSTSAPHYVVTPDLLKPRLAARNNQPLLLIDLAVPRDIDPAVNELDGVFVYNVDDLQAIAGEAMRQRQEEIARCDALIRERVRGLVRPPARAEAVRKLAFES